MITKQFQNLQKSINSNMVNSQSNNNNANNGNVANNNTNFNLNRGQNLLPVYIPGNLSSNQMNNMQHQNVMNMNNGLNYSSKNSMNHGLNNQMHNLVNDNANNQLSYGLFDGHQVNQKANLNLMLHPYLETAYKFNITNSQISKGSIYNISDFNLINMILAWEPKSRREINHKQLLVHAFTRMKEFELNINRVCDLTCDNGSVFSKVISKIDGQIYLDNGVSIDRRHVDSIYSDISLEYVKSLSNMAFYGGQGNSNQVVQKAVCRDFNSKGGCNRPSCQFRHICAYHYKRKIFANHSALDCQSAKMQENLVKKS